MVEIYRPTDDVDSPFGSGSGYLLDGELVLTAAHVVKDSSTVRVRLASGGDYLSCEVIWCRYDGLHRGVDAALIRILDPGSGPARFPPVRWGKPVTVSPCPVEVAGFPAGMHVWRDDQLGYRDTSHGRGEIMPGSRVKSGRYDVQMFTPIPREGVDLPQEKREGLPSRWSGMSGAAVCAGGLVVGVVVEDLDPSGRSLVAVPADALLADPDFRRHVGNVPVVPVELDDVLERPGPPARSPAGLLRAEAATVRFHGRDDLVAELLDWCDGEERFAVRLVTGRAGEGKSRLAYELVERLRRDGWCAGFLDPECPDERLPALVGLTEPLFLVVDYAEGRPERLAQLIRLLDRGDRRGGVALGVRLVLLARATGSWWDGLRSRTRLLRHLSPDCVITLPELDPHGAAHRDAVADLLTGLARVDRYREAAALIDPAEITPPRGRPRSGRALSVQMAALAGLLQHISPAGSGRDESDEEVLLHHEARFWEDTAPVHALGHLHRETLRRLVATATLCPVFTSGEAAHLLARLSLLSGETANTRTAVATWLHELYASDGRYWDALVPDALGEYLVGQVGMEFPALLDDLASYVDHSRAESMLTVLCRAAERFPHMADAIIRHVMTRPRPLAFAAIGVAVRAGHPVLIEALERLVAVSAVDPRLVADLLADIPQNTIALARMAVLLATRLVELRDPEPDEGRGLAELADARSQLAFRLSEVGRHDEALVQAAEAVRLQRELTERHDADPGGLADAMVAHAARLAESDRVGEAIDVAAEAVRLCRALDSRRRGQPDRVRLATALHHQAMWLHDFRQYAEAAAIGGEAVRIRASLVTSSPQFSADLAHSSLNYAGYLHDAGRSGEGLRYAREAVSVYRRLAEDVQDTYEVRFGRALMSLTRLLAVEDPAEAMACAEEAVGVYRGLVRSDTVDWLVEEFTMALSNYGRRLAACERTADAIEALEEAEKSCLRLADRGSQTVTDRLSAVRQHLVTLRRVADSAPSRGSDRRGIMAKDKKDGDPQDVADGAMPDEWKKSGEVDGEVDELPAE